MALGKGVRNQTLAAITATFGAMTMGTILGWALSANVLLAENGSLDVTADEIQTYCSLFGAGAVVGALPAGLVAGAVGHRYSTVLFEAFVVLGWTLLTALRATWMLIVGTVLQGFGTGALCAVIPTYVGEISQDHVRGRLGSAFQLFLVFGFLYSYALSTVCGYVTLNALCAVVPVVHVVGTFFAPESPYFLLSVDKPDEAAVSLTRLRDDGNVRRELSVLKDHIEEQTSQQNTLKKVFTDPANLKSLMFGVGCMFFQQMCGIVIMYYLRNLFLHFNSKPNQDHTTLITIGIVQIVISFVPMVFIDKIGRRILLIISAILMSFCLIGLTCYCSSHIELDSKVDWIILVLIAIYISSFTLGLGPVPLVIIGEIFSIKVKPYGTSIATAVNWSLFFLVTYFPKEMINFMSYFGIFLMYYIFCICCAGFVFFVMPETKGKSLIGIQLMLATDGDLPLSTPSRSNVFTSSPVLITKKLGTTALLNIRST